MDALKVEIKAEEQDIVNCNNINQLEQSALYPIHEVKHLYEIKIQYLQLLQEFQVLQQENHGEFKHEVRQFQKPYDNQQAEQISLMV